MGFGLILTGLIFFFNPNINCLDLLCDFFGCFFIIAGLSKLSLIDEDLAFAKKKAFHFIFISLLRLICASFIFTGSSDFALTFSFIFGVLDIMFLLSFFKHLYSGIDYTSKRMCNSVSQKKVSEAYTMSFIFVIATRILDFIPHSLDLLKQEAELDLSHDAPYRMPIYQIKPFVNVICFICSLIIGVIFLYVSISFFISLIKNKEYTSALENAHQARLISERDAIISKKLSRAFICLTIGFIFLLNFSIDAINILPDFICVCFFFGALCYVYSIQHSKKRIGLFTSCITVSIFAYIFSTYVSLGTNYNFQTQGYLSQKVEFLSSPVCIILSATIYLLFYVLLFNLFNLVLNKIKNIFISENRKGLIGMLTVSKVSAITSFCLCFLSKMSHTLIGHLSANQFISKYISTKYLISSEQLYNEYMQNNMIKNFETLLTIDTIIYICSFAIIIWNIIYTNRISCFSGE